MSLVKTQKNGDSWPVFLSDFFDSSRFFDNDFGALTKWATTKVPAANITENGKSYKIELAVPGMDKKNIKVDIENDIITISGEKEIKKEEKDEKYTRHEFSYNSFSRSFQLPQTIQSDKIDAKYENGVLKLMLPKKEEAIASTRKKEVKIV